MQALRKFLSYKYTCAAFSHFYARKQLLSYPSQFCLSVCLSVRPFVCHTGRLVKNDAS